MKFSFTWPWGLQLVFGSAVYGQSLEEHQNFRDFKEEILRLCRVRNGSGVRLGWAVI